MKSRSRYILVVWLFLASNLFLEPAQAAECSPEVTTNGSLTVVAFKAVGTCTWTTPASTTTFRGLIVAGGGGGGSTLGGGGGGGGLVEFDSLVATSDEFTIVVGAGGGGSQAFNYPGTSGDNSSISGTSLSLIARGGAGGASDINSNSYPARSNGGSGGGGAGFTQGGVNSSATQSSQSQTPLLSSISGVQFGFDGGAGRQNYYPGGGGGAGGAGSTNQGNGGSGRANDILGIVKYWAGGGGGSGYTGRAGNGGSGGGGGGGHTTVASRGSGGTSGINNGSAGTNHGGAGAANTGGGGGSGSYLNSGASGGSGVVILSYVRTVTVADLSLRLSTGTTSAVFRIDSTIEALVSKPGRVSFYQGGKPIAGCARKATTGTSPNIKATCTWKPSRRGSVVLAAIYTPSNINFSTARVNNFQVVVANRSTRR